WLLTPRWQVARPSPLTVRSSKQNDFFGKYLGEGISQKEKDTAHAVSFFLCLKDPEICLYCSKAGAKICFLYDGICHFFQGKDDSATGANIYKLLKIKSLYSLFTLGKPQFNWQPKCFM